MSKPVTTARRNASHSANSGGVEMYELSLPIPLDHERKLKALNFLNDSVQQYLDRYCGDEETEELVDSEEFEPEYDAKIRPKIFYPTPGQRNGPSAPAHPVVTKGKRGISAIHMVQLALCFFLIFYLW